MNLVHNHVHIKQKTNGMSYPIEKREERMRKRERERERERERAIDRQTDRQTDRQKERVSEKMMITHTHMQMRAQAKDRRII